MNELKVRKKKPSIKNLLLKKSKLTITPVIIIAFIMIASGAVVAAIGHDSKVSYIQSIPSVNQVSTLGYNQTFCSAIGIEDTASTQVILDSQYGNLSWGIWNEGAYTSLQGVTTIYNNEKYASDANSTSFNTTFPAGHFLNYGFGFYYIKVTNNNHKAQNVTVNVNILSPSTKYQYMVLSYIGVSIGLIGMVLFIAEITRIAWIKSEGKHLLKEKNWPT